MKKVILLIILFFTTGVIDLQADTRYYNTPYYNTSYNTMCSSRPNRRGHRASTRGYRRRSCNSRSYRSYVYDRYNYIAYDCDYCSNCAYCNYCPIYNYCNCDYYPSWSLSIGDGPRSMSYYY